MIMLDNTVVNVALPSIAADLGVGLSELQWIVTGYALTFAAFMLTGGKLADMIGRRLIFVAGLVIFTLSSLACGLATERRHADRRADRPGSRRGAHEPGDALDHRGHVCARTARDGDRHLGRRLGARARDRPARRRPSHRARRLELDLLREHPGRDPRDRRELPVHRRVARTTSRSPTARSARPRHVGNRPLCAHVRTDRGEHVRLDVAPDRRRVHGRRRDARRLRLPRAASEGADARPVAVQERDVHRARSSWSCSSRSRCSASSSSCRSTCRTSSATRRSRPGPRSCP